MLASICLEAIGHAGAAQAALWRGIIGACGRGAGDAVLGTRDEYERWGVWEVFPDNAIFRKVYGRMDYSQANGKGSRGVRVWYTLPTGRYLIHAPESWSSTDKYYITVTGGGEIVREANARD